MTDQDKYADLRRALQDVQATLGRYDPPSHPNHLVFAIGNVISGVDALAQRVAELTDELKSISRLFAISCNDVALKELQRDAARYRCLRRGQKWSTINGIGDTLRADELDAAIDAAIGSAKEGV